jgi:hypothetical protein
VLKVTVLVKTGLQVPVQNTARLEKVVLQVSVQNTARLSNDSYGNLLPRSALKKVMKKAAKKKPEGAEYPLASLFQN